MDDQSQTAPRPENDEAEYINRLSTEFDALCQERHEAGAKEYGSFTFLGNDVIRMMLEELADTANYCRMQFVKLMILQEAIESDPAIVGIALQAEHADDEIQINLGAQAFKGVGDVGWKKS